VVAVAFPVSCEVAFDYLADPTHRAEWQSSLARVEDVEGEPRVGQTWTDVTRPGLRPRMETTELDRPHRWSERGTWRGITATLTLEFAETATGCDVTATFDIARLLRRPALWAVRGDLRHAASNLQP
jgi:Polyketide cyclase / dehydrase and lipid transport